MGLLLSDFNSYLLYEPNFPNLHQNQYLSFLFFIPFVSFTKKGNMINCKEKNIEYKGIYIQIKNLATQQKYNTVKFEYIMVYVWFVIISSNQIIRKLNFGLNLKDLYLIP